jgi:glycosidase
MNGLAKLYGDWIRKYKVDGFRVDTARHVNAAFFRLWTPKILAAARSVGIADLPVFGEVFSTDSAYVSEFVRDRGLPFTLDFPFQDAAAGYAAGTSSARALRDRLDDDDYWRTTNGVAPTAPTFLGNHDIGRAAYRIRSHGGRENLLERVLLAYDLMYLMRGAPTVYYGDEVGMIGSGGDQAARQDMFPTQVQSWQTEERLGAPPIARGSSFDVTDQPIEAELRKLGALRDGNPALSTGATIVRYASGRVLVFSRIDAAARREYVAAFNAGTTTEAVILGTSSPATTWTTLLGSAAPGNGPAGQLALALPPLSAVLVRADANLPAAPARAPSLRVSGDNLSSMWQIAAAVPGKAPVSVAFGLKRGKAGWRRLAVDDTPPYRAFLDPAKFRRNEPVQLVAVTRALDGSTAVSSVVGFTVRPR